ncbi:MAG: winged helix-turn-helix domain-containing protein [Myxococcota bacterium]
MGNVVRLSDRNVDLDSGLIDNGRWLRPMELKLLRHLDAQRGRAVSREDLLEQVWGYRRTSRSRTLYATLHRLRAALEADPTAPRHVETVAGEGVRLNVPDEPTARQTQRSFVGRSDALALLAAPHDRVTTVLGAGGVGKTRLVQEHLTCAAATHPERWLCELGRATTAAQVVEAVARAMGMPTPESADELGRAMARRGRALLVLDDADPLDGHLATLVAAWQQHAPKCRVILTARQRLGIAHEQALLLGPLSGPDRPDTLTGDAVALFLLRLRAGDPTFDPEPHTAPILALLDAVDRLPLAIEIAAGHAAVIGPRAVLHALDRHRDLASRRPDRPPRHASLEAVIAWSWARMAPADQRALASVQLFRAPFDLAGAEAVLPEEPPAHEVVARLVDRGMLQRRIEGDAVRFALLHTVRRFLAQHPAPPEAEARYVARYQAEAAQRFVAWEGLPRSYAPCGGVDAEEVLHAAEICLARDPARCGALTVCALVVADAHGLCEAGTRLLEQASAAPLDPLDELLLLDRRDAMLLRTGQVTASAELRGRCAATAAALGRADLAAFFGARHALALVNVGRLDEAREALARAEDAAGDTPSQLLSATLDSARGSIAYHAEDPAAIRTFRRAVAALADAGLHQDARSMRLNLCTSLARFDRVADAERELRQLVDELAPDTAPGRRGTAFAMLASALHRRGDRAAGLEAADQSVALLERAWDTGVLPVALLTRGALSLDDGDLDAAEGDAERALAMTQRVRNVRAEVLARLLLGRTALQRRSPDAGAQLEACVARAQGLGGLGRSLQHAVYYLVQHDVRSERLEGALARVAAWRAGAGDAEGLAALEGELAVQLGRPAPSEAGVPLPGELPAFHPARAGAWAQVRTARARVAKGDAAGARRVLRGVSHDPEDELLNRAVRQLHQVTPM